MFTQNFDSRIPQEINMEITADALSNVAPTQKNAIDSISTNLSSTIGKTHICYVKITFSNDLYPAIQKKYMKQW